ncbi:MAG: endo alpha-1,4 polygalactosaminidase [Candidatus Thiodiazotropha sp.]
MKKTSVYSFVFGILGTFVGTLPGYTLADMRITVPAASLSSVTGKASKQDLSVLSVQDQSGDDDRWNSYVEFYPSSDGYQGEFTFSLPDSYAEETISDITFFVNYRGPDRSEQRWYWKIKDFSTNRWVDLVDNQSAPSWEWTVISAYVNDHPDRFVDAGRTIKLRYATDDDHDDSDLDYVAVKVGSTPADDADDGSDDDANDTAHWQPTPGTSWQIQIMEDIDTSYNVDVYDIDLFDATEEVIDELHAQGKKVICYFSAGSFENWRPDADQYPESVKGESNGWSGEKWLDIRQIDILGKVIEPRLDDAREKGCDGVDPDNMDGYANTTGFPLTYQDQIAFNVWVAELAHSKGLSVGLKNDLDQIEDLVDHYDWAVNEQCVQYEECELLLPFIESNKAVFGIEYEGNPSVSCPVANEMGFDTLFKDIDLTAERIDCKNY